LPKQVLQFFDFRAERRLDSRYCKLLVLPLIEPGPQRAQCRVDPLSQLGCRFRLGDGPCPDLLRARYRSFLLLNQGLQVKFELRELGIETFDASLFSGQMLPDLVDPRLETFLDPFD
jgi:hypothetical protein